MITSETITGVDSAYFSTPGMIAQSDIDNFAEDNNAWCIVTDITEKTPANTPFIFTKNFNLSGDLSTLSETEPLLDAKGMPFGGKVGVVVTKGGAVKVLDLKYLVDSNGSSDKLGKELFNPPASIIKNGASRNYEDGIPMGFLTPSGSVEAAEDF